MKVLNSKRFISINDSNSSMIKRGSFVTLLVCILILVVSIGISGCGQEKGTIKIGAVLPLTGVASYPGEQAKTGITLAVEEINANGGINGKQIKLFIEDSKSAPAEGVSAFNKLVEVDNVDVVISALSSVSMAIAPLANEKKIPVLGIMVTATNFVQNDYTFRYQPMADLEIDPVLYIIEKENLSNIGILYSSDELGNSVYTTLSNKLSQTNKKLHGESFLVTEKDFNTPIMKLMNKNIDSLYVVGFDSHITKIIPQIKNLNFKGKIISLSPLSLPTARQRISNINEGIYLASPPIYCSQIALSDEATNLKQKLDQKGATFDHYIAISYDSVKVIAFNLDKKDTSSRDKMKEDMKQLTEYSGVFGNLIITNEGHEIAYKFYPAVINNNSIQCFIS